MHFSTVFLVLSFTLAALSRPVVQKRQIDGIGGDVADDIEACISEIDGKLSSYDSIPTISYRFADCVADIARVSTLVIGCFPRMSFPILRKPA